ncbi:Transmembrane emp24 domain-containing protein 10 [Sarcoptes scabiei]|uniref:Transmembrane emp24 domain-containing protein 10 n=1 Tax=Sarcoptes scabiei TaxID=52283 RepID=A0A132A3D2_SARSC|nr:Transmembrane emp24 domain-containing protein 10 [Sarcoptes scabiei]KPM05115.1 transmembrane emp24 domain-containing protein bai-like protein [Sarcoptes scabiei]UXI17420.1 E3 ubiquitin-protein ligase synoviolin [Sarcoptes scabiei]
MNLFIINSIFLLLLDHCRHCSSIRFYLQPNTKRCLKEEMRKDVLVTGNYSLSESLGVRTDLMITDTKGHTALNRENIDKGIFAVNSDEDDIFDFCFISYLQAAHQMPQPREVHLEMKHGVETKNYDQIGAVAKLKPLELELQKLEDLSASVVEDFEYMRKREQAMRDTNESTNARIFYLSIFSMLCLLGLAMWQIFYLRQFFKAKKLID